MKRRKAERSIGNCNTLRSILLENIGSKHSCEWSEIRGSSQIHPPLQITALIRFDASILPTELTDQSCFSDTRGWLVSVHTHIQSCAYCHNITVLLLV